MTLCCAVCNYSPLKKFLDLGHHPPSDAFLTLEKLNGPEVTYPLQLVFCPRCALVQLSYSVTPALLFGNYVYTTGTNNSLKRHFEDLVRTTVRRFHTPPRAFAVDIGSNDGTLLSFYRPYGIRILGVDPSSIALSARRHGIPTLIRFFNAATAQEIKKKFGPADIITATNVFAHVPKLASFVRGLKQLLAADGVAIIESHYLLDIIKKLQYDSVYHEHLYYYSLRPLIHLFRKHKLDIFDAERIDSHNGSLRIFMSHPGRHTVSQDIKLLLKEEARAGLYDFTTMKEFARQVGDHRRALSFLIFRLRKVGKRVVGIGAPAKGNTLLNACHLGPEYIDYLTEKSLLKIGLFSPSQHIPVVNDGRLVADQPEYALVLSWNITAELIAKARAAGYRGKFIIPFPRLIIK